MKFMLFVCVIIAVSLEVCESKGGGRALSRIASSRGSSSGGWFGGGSKSKSSSSSGGAFSGWFGGSKSSGSKPSSSGSSYGWNVGNTQSVPKVSSPSSGYGWNVGNTQSVPKVSPSNTNYGWNVGKTQTVPKPSAPVGPPPSYPGLQNRPVNSYNNPPAYSPSYNSPPAYSPGIAPSYSNNYNRQPSYQTNYHNSHSSPSFGSGYSGGYGSGGFGGGNTYVNNYYGGGSRSSSGSSFLTYGLLYGAGMHHGHSMGRSSSSRRWDDEEDRRWRATTKAPYFENKQPGSDSVLPAAAVLGAATAFGVYSLLPLNVPNGKPILSCNATDIQQTQINFNGSTYGCSNKTVTVSCFKVDPITNATIDFCAGKTLECDKTSEISDIPNMSCTNGTLLSSESIFCNSTTILNGTNVNDTTKLLNCYSGVLPTNIAASVPTQIPVTTTEKPKSLSMGAKVHKFLLWTIGKSDITKKPLPTTTEKPGESTPDFVPRFLSENDTIALIPTTTVAPINETTLATINETTLATINETATLSSINETATLVPFDEIKKELADRLGIIIE